MTRFPDKKQGDKLGASHINALNDVAKQIFYNQPGSNVSGYKGMMSTGGPWHQGLFIVTTDHGDEVSDESSSSASGDELPCGTRFEIQPRYFDQDSNSWLTDENDGPYCLDASAFGNELEVGDIVVAFWDEQRDSYVAIYQPTPVPEEGGGGGTSGSSGCCCDEMNCLRIPGSPTIQVRPAYYEFTPGSLVCGCTPAALAQRTVKLYPVDTDYLIWESRHGEDDEDVPMCLGTEEETVNCTTNARWRWSLSASCSGSCLWVSQLNDAGTEYVWVNFGNSCDVSCGSYGGSCNSSQPAEAPTGDAQNTSTPCLQDPGWQLEGLDDPDCVCTPTEPDYTPDWDGTGDAPTAITVCEGTKVTDSSETLLRSFWRLTIVEDLTYFGCDETKLEFIIGEA